MRKNNIHGGGKRTNEHGLTFEGRTNFIDSIKNNKNFNVSQIRNFNKSFKIYFKNKKIGFYAEKNEFYKLLFKGKSGWKKLISKQYLPDAVFINEINKTVYIIEKKFQARAGSVDEKLQTCDFKRKIYTKIVSNCKKKYETKYYFLLSSWFEKKEYNDVKDYINSVGCKYFINKIDLIELGLT